MTDIRQIAQDIYGKEKTISCRDLIENFEKHQLIIDTINHEATPDAYDIYARLIADYGMALAEAQSYKKAIPVIDKALDLFRNNKKYTAGTLRNVKLYEMLLFNRGESYYCLNKYELARPDFALLVKLYPDNSIYPKWINAIRNKNLYRLRNILWYCVAGTVLIVSFLDGTTLINNMIAGIGLLSLLGAIGLEITLYFRKRKYS